VLEAAALNLNMLRAANRHGGWRPADPRLIVETAPVERAFGSELVRVDQIHPGLQRDVSMSGRSPPGGVLKLKTA
jgi:hypothetical protein